MSECKAWSQRFQPSCCCWVTFRRPVLGQWCWARNSSALQSYKASRAACSEWMLSFWYATTRIRIHDTCTLLSLQCWLIIEHTAFPASKSKSPAVMQAGQRVQRRSSGAEHLMLSIWRIRLVVFFVMNVHRLKHWHWKSQFVCRSFLRPKNSTPKVFFFRLRGKVTPSNRANL